MQPHRLERRQGKHTSTGTRGKRWKTPDLHFFGVPVPCCGAGRRTFQFQRLSRTPGGDVQEGGYEGGRWRGDGGRGGNKRESWKREPKHRRWEGEGYLRKNLQTWILFLLHHSLNRELWQWLRPSSRWEVPSVPDIASLSFLFLLRPSGGRSSARTPNSSLSSRWRPSGRPRFVPLRDSDRL